MSLRTWTVLITVLVLTLIGGPALGYFSTSPKSVGVTITAAHEFPSDEGDDSDDEDDSDDDEDEDDQEDDQAGAGELVWICKLTGQPDDPRLAKQNNPRQVNGSAIENGVFNDEHGSPVVQDGHVDCDEVWPLGPKAVIEADSSDEAEGNDEDEDDVEGDGEDDVEGDDSEGEEDEENEEDDDGNDDGGDVDDENEDDDL